MTRKPLLQQVLEGVKRAQNYGFDIKINAVVLKGINESEILPLIEFGIKNDISVRFLELMKMGYLHHDFGRYYFSQEAILKAIQQKYQIHKTLRENSSTANYWQVEGKQYQFGIIANESEPFCSDCDRLRLDSQGNIYGCISSSKGFNVQQKTKTEIKHILSQALQQKQSRFVGSEISMRYLGG